ncbi:acyltransferase family protein [Actinomyces naeslundii]|uniref:Acyltransferase n=1 Tax=Actinomyces naeslundii TaxID=1655 RepID=A0ABX3F2K5_ACTNA|nr:acyltransferase [Actinomyces naeslundii]OMG11682.1 acyltransferase [Actinomyces naeslundii]OMG22688.1 acyltransferase [Actinomyces naeslundii]
MPDMTTKPAQHARTRTRIFYLDLIRALAALLIVLTHFNAHLREHGGGYVLTFEPFGIYLGALGVSLFLIISGAALTFTYRRPIDLKRFYWKRFLNIYPMFWTAWVLGTLSLFLVANGRPPNAAPLRSFVFTLLGIDGLAQAFYFRTMYLLGEWFLGFILLYYVVFPLLLWAIDRFPVITGAVLLVAYVATIVIMSRYFPAYPSAAVLTTRLPELAFGSYFVLYIRRIHGAVVVPAAAVLAVSAMFPGRIPEDVGTTIVGISVFLILVVAGRYVAIQPVRALVSLIATYSYPIFLVHHVVIEQALEKIDVAGFYPIQRYMLLAAECVIIFALSVALVKVADAVTDFFTKAFKGMTWRSEVSEAER